MRNNDGKSFVRKHKKEIAIGAAGLVIGYMASRRVTRREFRMIQEARQFSKDQNGFFGSLADGFTSVSKGASGVNVFQCKSTKPLDDYVDHMNDFYKDSKPEITGMLVFTK